MVSCTTYFTFTLAVSGRPGFPHDVSSMQPHHPGALPLANAASGQPARADGARENTGGGRATRHDYDFSARLWLPCHGAATAKL